MQPNTSHTPQQQSSGWKGLLARGYQGATSAVKNTGQGIAWVGRGVAQGATSVAQTATSGTMKGLRVGNHLAQGLYSAGATATKATYYQGSRVIRGAATKLTDAGTVLSLGARIIRQANAAIDSSDQIQTIAGISPSIRREFKHVHPQVVTIAQKRFGEEALHDLDALTSAAWSDTSTVKRFLGGLVTDPKAVMNTTAISAVTLLADRAKALMPDGDNQARTIVGEGIARELDYVLTEIEQCAPKVRSQGLDWNRPGFEAQFNAELAQSPLVKAQGSVNQFYQRLALRLRQEIDNAIASAPNAQNAEMLKSLLDLIDWKSPVALQDFLFEFLKKVHEDLCSPTRIKELLINIMDSTSESLEQNLDDYLQMIASPSPVTPQQTASMDPSYGHSLMSILQTLQPRALGTNILGVYAKFQGSKIANGTDFLSVILRDATGKVIEKEMAPDTDLWITAALKLARAKLLDPHGQFITKPYYISDTVWAALSQTPGAQQKAADPKTKEGKSYKEAYEKNIDRQFSLSTKRIARSVLRSGFVADQFFESSKAKSTNMARGKAYRIFWSIIAFIIGLPVIKHILKSLRQLNVRLRLLFADIGSPAAGYSIDHRVTAFLRSDAIQHICMHMIERTLEHAHLLPTTGSVLGSGVQAPTPGCGPVPVAPLPMAAVTSSPTPSSPNVNAVATGASPPVVTSPTPVVTSNAPALNPPLTPTNSLTSSASVSLASASSNAPAVLTPIAQPVTAPVLASTPFTISHPVPIISTPTSLASSPHTLSNSHSTSSSFDLSVSDQPSISDQPQGAQVTSTTPLAQTQASRSASPLPLNDSLSTISSLDSSASDHPLTLGPAIASDVGPTTQMISPNSSAVDLIEASPPSSPLLGQTTSLPSTSIRLMSASSSPMQLQELDRDLAVRLASDDQSDDLDLDAGVDTASTIPKRNISSNHVEPGTYNDELALTKFQLFLEELYAHDKRFASDLMKAFFDRKDLISFTLDDNDRYTLTFNEEKSVVLPQRDGGLGSLQNYRVIMSKNVSGWVNPAVHTLEFDAGCLRFHYYGSRSSLTAITYAPGQSDIIKASFNSWTQKEQTYNKEAFLRTFEGLMT